MSSAYIFLTGLAVGVLLSQARHKWDDRQFYIDLINRINAADDSDRP